MLKDSTIFAKLDLEVMRAFSSKYAFSLYEAIARRIRMRMFSETLSLEDLRQMLGVEDGKLTTYKNLNIRAIQPALTEVNAITPYQVLIAPGKTTSQGTPEFIDPDLRARVLDISPEDGLLAIDSVVPRIPLGHADDLNLRAGSEERS